MNKSLRAFIFLALAACGVALGVIGSTRNITTSFNTGTPSYPSSYTSSWTTAIDAGGLTTVDASSITNPTTEIVASTTHIIAGPVVGGYTTVTVRGGYVGTSLTGITPLRLAVFGRTGTDAWQRLRNLNGDLYITLSPNTTTDERDGTYWYTAVDPLLHVFDTQGCNQFVLGIETPFASTAGSFATAFVQVKGL